MQTLVVTLTYDVTEDRPLIFEETRIINVLTASPYFNTSSQKYSTQDRMKTLQVSVGVLRTVETT